MDLEKLICSALDLLRPAISDLLLRKSGKKGFYWVVLDPKTGAVAVTGKYGEPDDRHDYAAIALSKANQAWGSGLPNRLIPPTALEPGDTPYYGSWVCEGIACGVSGVEPWYDELLSMWLSTTTAEMAFVDLQIWKQQNPEADFLPS